MHCAQATTLPGSNSSQREPLRSQNINPPVRRQPMTNLVFTDEELKELATAPGDRAAAALDRGDTAAAREIASGSVDLHFSTRDIYLAWNTLTLGYIEREFGAQTLERSVPAC